MERKAEENMTDCFASQMFARASTLEKVDEWPHKCVEQP